jgi:flagellar biosynthetic protein FliR
MKLTEVLVGDFVTGLLIFLRITAMIFVAPVFNSTFVPKFVKLLLSLTVTYVIFFTVPKMEFSPDDSLLPLALYGIKEVITGLIMGYMLNFVFWALSFAGFLLSREIGLMMANMFDPNSEANDNIIGALLVFLGIMIFFIIKGPEYIITSLSFSFKAIPLGSFTFNESVFQLIIRLSAQVFVLGLKIASPLIVAFFLVHVASGIISRISPTFQVFFVLLPLKLGLGIFLMILMLPVFAYAIRDILSGYENNLMELLKAMSQ